MIHKFEPYYGDPPVVPLSHAADFGCLMGLAAGQRAIGKWAVEIGTFTGITTSNIARMLPRHKVLTVGLAMGTVPSLRHHEGDMYYNGAPTQFAPDVAHRITYLQQDSATLDVRGMAIGFAFIDGSHTFDYVVSDFNLLYPQVVDGGLIVFHDHISGHEEVIDAVTHLSQPLSHHQWGSFGALAWCRKLTP